MTITSGKAVKEILMNGGRDEEGRFSLIYSYTLKGSAETLYALFVHPDHDDMDAAGNRIENVICLFANGVLTIDGQEFIKER